MNKAAKILIASVLIITPALAYGRYQQYPLANPSAQQQYALCSKFFAKPLSLNDSKMFLRKQSIEYSELPNSDIFVGNAFTEFQRAHKQEVNSELIFRIHDIEEPLCGKTDALFIVSFDRKGQLLKTEKQERNWGCFDF